MLRVFEQNLDAGKSLFAELAKKIKSKKAIVLEERLFFLQTYLELLGKIHFTEKKLSLKTFKAFEPIFRSLKKVNHIKLITTGYLNYCRKQEEVYPLYELELTKLKKTAYAELFDLILATPLKIWEDLYAAVYYYSQNLSPLQLNTASTQIINEEIDFFHVEAKNKLDPPAIKSVYDGLNKIILLENIRITGGLNPVFTLPAHEKIRELHSLLQSWHENHLFLQHFAHFLREKEEIEKKYLILVKQIKKTHKALTEEIVKQCEFLFTKILH